MRIDLTHPVLASETRQDSGAQSADPVPARAPGASQAANRARQRSPARGRRPRFGRAMLGARPLSSRPAARATVAELKQLRAETAELLAGALTTARPRTRGECEWCPTCQKERDWHAEDARGEQPKLRIIVEYLACGHRADEAVRRSRPCVFPSCRHNLLLEINGQTGSIKLLHGDDYDGDTCSLDVADRGGVTLDVVGRLTNVTRERARQIETAAIAQLRLRRKLLG